MKPLYEIYCETHGSKSVNSYRTKETAQKKLDTEWLHHKNMGCNITVREAIFSEIDAITTTEE